MHAFSFKLRSYWTIRYEAIRRPIFHIYRTSSQPLSACYCTSLLLDHGLMAVCWMALFMSLLARYMYVMVACLLFKQIITCFLLYSLLYLLFKQTLNLKMQIQFLFNYAIKYMSKKSIVFIIYRKLFHHLCLCVQFISCDVSDNCNIWKILVATIITTGWNTKYHHVKHKKTYIIFAN